MQFNTVPCKKEIIKEYDPEENQMTFLGQNLFKEDRSGMEVKKNSKKLVIFLKNFDILSFWSWCWWSL